MTVAIALGTLFACVAPLYFMLLTFKQSAAQSYEGQLERRVESLEKELAACKDRVLQLEDENVRLMRKLVAAGG